MMRDVPGHATTSSEIFHREGMDPNKICCNDVLIDGSKEETWEPSFDGNVESV